MVPDAIAQNVPDVGDAFSTFETICGVMTSSGDNEFVPVSGRERIFHNAVFTSNSTLNMNGLINHKAPPLLITRPGGACE